MTYDSRTIYSRLFRIDQEDRRFLKRFIVHMPLESWVWFIYHYFLRLGILEGRPGFIACRIRAAYVAQVRSKLYELNIESKVETKPFPEK